MMGTGHVAWHLAPALYKAGMGPALVYGRNEEKARELATACQSGYSTDARQAARGCDMLILCLGDDAIGPVLEQARPDNDCMLVHTAGSRGIDVLKGYARKTGVLYPLQTFTKGRRLDFGQVPLFLEAHGSGAEQMLRQVAGRLSTKVHWLSSGKRARLHLAAVFACNYVNYMYTLGETIVKQTGQDFEVLAPLIVETANKAIDLGPSQAQTGPAQRGDRKTMEKHMQLIDDQDGLKKLYEEIAQLISQSQKTKP